MKIDLYTFCWNEMRILPWAVSAWRQFADSVTVFDNGSTDGSREYLRDVGATVIPFGGEKKNNTEIRDLKNSAWLASRGKADMVVVCDLDEILRGANIRDAFSKMQAAGGTICRPLWYDLMWDIAPVAKEDQQIEETMPYGVRNVNPKALIFDPNKIESINYTAGAHRVTPSGIVREWQAGNGIVCFHINNSLCLKDKLDRYHTLNARRSDDDRQKRHGVHYAYPDDRIIKEWDNARRHAVNLGGLLWRNI